MRVDGGGVVHADIAGDMSHSEKRWGGEKIIKERMMTS